MGTKFKYLICEKLECFFTNFLQFKLLTNKLVCFPPADSTTLAYYFCVRLEPLRVSLSCSFPDPQISDFIMKRSSLLLKSMSLITPLSAIINITKLYRSFYDRKIFWKFHKIPLELGQCYKHFTPIILSCNNLDWLWIFSLEKHSLL
jgi:hypothetical protein